MVITQGGDPIIVVEGNNLIEYPVTKLTIDEIRDTNGAGDAFVGGASFSFSFFFFNFL